MGNMVHQWRKGINELRESVRLSEVFSTVQQRKGDRLVKAFILTFCISMALGHTPAFRTSTPIPSNIRSRLTTWTTDAGLTQNSTDQPTLE